MSQIVVEGLRKYYDIHQKEPGFIGSLRAFLLLATSAFWFVQLENVMELLYTFFEAGRFPITIFPAWVRLLLTFIVPIAFITTVPASVLLGRLDGIFAFYSLGVTAALFTASALFWRYAVRHYSSASS